MADTITNMLAVNFDIDTAYTVTITDDNAVNRVETLNTGSFRTYLVHSASSNGTESNPYCLLKSLQSKLGAKWTVTMTDTGKAKINYLGTVTTGSITFGANDYRKLLGFTTSNTGGSYAIGGSASRTAQYQPFGAVFSIARVNDSGWQRLPSLNAYADLPDGSTYGWSDSNTIYERKCDFKFFPTTSADKTTFTSNSTLVFPSSSADWKTPLVTESTYNFDFSLIDFLYLAPGKPVAVTWGEFQNHVAGTETDFDIVYLTSKTINNNSSIKLSIPKYSPLRDYAEFQVRLYRSDTRA